MKAITQDVYGSPDVLELRDIDKPVAGGDKVLVRVRACSVNPLDWHLMRGLPYIARLSFGRRRPEPSVRGVDLAGVVEAVGENVKRLQPGDEVYGSCNSAFAEYVRAREHRFVRKPASVTFEQAAAVPVAGCTALQALRDIGKVRAGHKVLINGAAGGVGTFAVQIAKSFGAEVTAVCSARNEDLVRSIGADHVIDYGRVDFARSSERYDVVVDNMYRPLTDLGRALAPEGTVALVGGSSGRWINGVGRAVTAPLWSAVLRRRMASFLAETTNEDLTALIELVEAGKVKPVIDRTYSLADAPEAIRYLEQGHVRGKVVITV